MRNLKISPGEYYHIYNRGVNRENIFLNERDYIRFLFLILHLQSTKTFFNLEDYVNNYIRHRVFNVSKKSLSEITDNRLVELVVFCLMPNHFHLLVLEKKEGGMAKYMQRVLNAYTKYFNTKYKRGGHIFQGPYRAVHIATNNQLLHLSAYIHKNPKPLKNWGSNFFNYPWSSIKEYTEDSVFGELVKNEIIENQFQNKKEYVEFIKTSSAKEKIGETMGLLLIDSEDKH